ncbi:MAG: nucleotidyltransferase domain-containing protein [Cytophagaceae bacterium]|nr:nucleotidyltransferase domain-containing protein [Cytophagaceae bacterium]
MVDKEAVIRDVVEILNAHYGPRLDRIILYGSYARGDFHDESDMDFLVLLNDEDVSARHELQAYGPAIHGLLPKYGIVVSVMPASVEHFRTSNRAIYRFIRQDGVTVYE